MRVRAAAYCRVSTGKEDQLHSLENQRNYFEAHIRAHPGWELAGIYADEGLSGTDVGRREAFVRMLEDAAAGRLDLILTKEVSRFARNTVDALRWTRRLRELGVGVVFLSDGIDTREGDGELRLTLMASMAQEESRKISQRVKWGQRRRMEAGVVFGNDSTYGFWTRNGQLTVREEEAAVVREIYRRYLHEGKGDHVIARELGEAGIPPPGGPGGRWSPATVRRVLTNEKYAGDLRQKKYVTLDHLTHKKVLNRGIEEQIYLRDHHAAVVDRDTWEGAQAERARRKAGRNGGARYSGRYWCSGKLRCGICGGPCFPRTARRKDGSRYVTWACRRRAEGGDCSLGTVNDKVLRACARFALERALPDWENLRDGLCAELSAPAAAEGSAVRARLRTLEERRRRAAAGYADGVLTAGELAELRARLDRAEKALRQMGPRPVSEAPDWAAALEELRTADEVLAAGVERIALYRGRVELRLWGGAVFSLRYAARGRGTGYTVTVTEEG